MRIKNILALHLLLCSVLFYAMDGFAADIYLEGELSNGSYTSDENIILQNNCTINSGTEVIASAAFETILKPGTRIHAGGRLTVRIRDNDGLSNRCEMLYFGHLDYGPQDDPDVDWLDNYAECNLATNPNLHDLDNDDDGLADWWEVKYFGYTLEHGYNADSDGDGVANYLEFKLGANPALNDLPGTGVHYEYDALGRIKRIFRIPVE